MYFYDVGLAAFLLGIEQKNQLISHPLKGSLFETLVMGELIKYRFNKIRKSNLYYFRDNAGHEIDALVDYGAWCNPVEIKLSETIHPDFFKTLLFYQNLQNQKQSVSYLVYGGEESYRFTDTEVVSYKEIHKVILS